MSPKPTVNRPGAGVAASPGRARRGWSVAVAAFPLWLLAGILWTVLVSGQRAFAQTNEPAGSSHAGGIAVSIVYDGSGSMAYTVPGLNQQPTPKYQIANQAVASILRQLAAFSQQKHVELQAGLVYFAAGKIHPALALTNLTSASEAALTEWTTHFRTPSGGTPLGLAIRAAREQLETSACPHKHILVITDGESNSGVAPDRVVQEIRASGNPVGIYFVAFDINASVFDPVKAQGATVVSASDAIQLNAEINHLLGQKILLEAE